MLGIYRKRLEDFGLPPEENQGSNLLPVGEIAHRQGSLENAGQFRFR
jgi:hypothetical protein